MNLLLSDLNNGFTYFIFSNHFTTILLNANYLKLEFQGPTGPKF